MIISIITPNYNSGEFIERTINSVLSQKGIFELEYIIVDGGSTDNSIEIIKKYDELLKLGKYKINCQKIAFKWISEKDKGQSDAINKGLKLSTGDIVSYLNSDDTYEQLSLQIVMDFLINSQSKRCYGKCKIIDKNDLEIRSYITFYKNFLGKNFSYGKLLSENFISQMTVFWKKEVMEEIGLFDINEHLCMDYEYRLRLGKKYNPIYINRHLSNFRLYNTSKSGSKFVKQFQDELRIATKYANGKYKFSIFMHRINVYKIIFVYKFLSFLKK